MTVRAVTLADAVLVAAAVTSLTPDELLDGTDLTLLVLVTGRAREAGTVAAAAADLLVGVSAGRPFPSGDRGAAWALAAYVATVNRRRLDLSPHAVRALLDAVTAGELDEPQVAARLGAAMSDRPGALRRFVTSMCAVPPAPPTIDWACPECGRAVPERPYRSSAYLAKPLPGDVVRDCSVRHRAHGPAGSDVAQATSAVRRPVPLRRAEATADLARRGVDGATASDRCTS